MTHHSDKNRLRREMRRVRRHVSDRVARNRQIARRLLAWHDYRHAGRPMLYVSTEVEVETRPILQDQVHRHGSAIVPLCDGKNLRAVAIDDYQQLIKSELGIYEPHPEIHLHPERQVTPNRIDLIFVPGVAFDLEGGRLGQGGGFYDRFLADIPTTTLKVALAYECQIVESVPMDKHDHRVDVILTEERLVLCQD